MPTEANTKRAEDLIRCHPRCKLGEPTSAWTEHSSRCAWRYRETVALALDAAEQRGRESVEAELRRLRERIELMATHHEKSVTAYVAVQPRGEHRAIARAFRELLAEHDAKPKEG